MLVIDGSETNAAPTRRFADQVEIVLGQFRLVQFLIADFRGKIQGMNLRPRQVEGHKPSGGPIVSADFQNDFRSSIEQQAHQCDLVLNSQ